MAQKIRLTVDLTGILQGVGFRPTLSRLVSESGLSGWTRNQSSSVRLVLAGEQHIIETFLAQLPEKLPKQARLESIKEVTRESLPDDYTRKSFMILDSQSSGMIRISIPADLSMCDECKRDVLSNSSRYYGYPFTTCTNCGPRYTVVDSMPYDRANTTLNAFPLCDECTKEYTDPFNRRFHAQSVACANCGPSLSLFDGDGTPLDGEPLQLTRRAIAEGKIVAVRGLGGYLLAANALDNDVIQKLRDRKCRPHKPFAVMAKDLNAAKKYCLITDRETEWLVSSRGPIVILNLLPEFADQYPFRTLTPGIDTLGVMLPTTPLHLLLANPIDGDPTGPFDLLVMTSGNRSGEPICLSNEEAFDRLEGIADLFLCHNRDIHFRNDDSVAVSMAGKMQLWRRARGFAPRSIKLRTPLNDCYMGFGAQLKNTIALGFHTEIVASPHIGDLETPEALDGMAQVVDRFPEYFKHYPHKILVDLHPDMQATRRGVAYANLKGLPIVKVQHHHAHAAACMAEHGLESAIGLVFDGTGLGTDGTIWGAELLHVYPGGFRRFGTFKGVPLPGGDAAVREPARQLWARWFAAGVPIGNDWAEQLGVTSDTTNIWETQCEKMLNTPITHGAGRVFDAYAMMLGVSPTHITFEGQGAIRLESVARRAMKQESQSVPFHTLEVDNTFIVDFAPAFERFSTHLPKAKQIPPLAKGFHLAMIDAACQMVQYGVDRTGCKKIVLSGGVMMNRLLSDGIVENLSNQGIEVFLHRLLPPNDGGISIGQVYAIGGNR